MLSPSAAPRWKITTSRLPVVLDSVVPNAARVRNDGMAAVPTTAIAPPLRNVRLVMLMTLPLFVAQQTHPSSALKLRRSQQQRDGCVRMRQAIRSQPITWCCADLALNRLVRLWRNLAIQQYLLQPCLTRVRIARLSCRVTWDLFR